MFEFFRKADWPEIPFEEIKKRARLLVVDDSEFPYGILFTRDGYTVEKWPDIQDLPKLESGYYDIILLDLQGVGREQSAEQGLGVLRHLRRSSPAQVIIAYSSADWSLKYQEFFNLADAVLAKTSDYVDFKRTVDQLLEQRYSLGFYISRVRSLLAPTVRELTRVEKLVRDAIRGRSPNKLESYLENKDLDPQLIGNVLSVVQIAIGIAGLWKQ